MPAAIKLQEEFGDDLTVIFVESQGTSPEDTEAFIYRMKWGASEAWWTHERPVPSSGGGLPSQALIGNQGQVLMEGHLALSRMKNAIRDEIKEARSAPKDVPRALAKGYQDFAKGAYASAIQLADKLAETPADRDRDGIVEAAQAAAAEWRARASGRIDRLKYLIDNAHFARAESEVKFLKGAVKGLSDLEEKLDAHAKTLDGDELKNAREAARALDKVMERVHSKGVDARLSGDLQKLAEKYSGTVPGERAAHLARILSK